MDEKVAKPFQKGYKFRIYPTNEQKHQLAKMFGSCRFAWNTLVAKSEKDYQEYREQIRLGSTPVPDYPKTDGYYFSSLLTELKKEHTWLRETSAVALQQTVLRLGATYINFFKGRKLSRKPGKPKFKSRHGRQSMSLMSNSFSIKEGKLYVAKLEGSLDVLWSRELPLAPSSCSISKTPSGKYFVSFVCEYTPIKTTGTKVTGVDLGLTHLAILSDGTKIDNPKYYQKLETLLKRRQRSLSRKKKGSSNRNKARLIVATLYERIANQRNDYLHKLSRKLVNENQVIGLETLKVANMLRNHKLAKGIQSASWRTLTNHIVYKAKESQHCVIVMMNQYFLSSHLCSVTGKKLDRKLTLKERQWECPHCHETHDRDINAAQNIAIEALNTVEKHGLTKIPHNGTVYVSDYVK